MEREELEQLLTCPLHWSEVCEALELVHWLQFAWYATALRYQVAGEVQSLISYDDFAPSGYELDLLAEHSSLRPDLLNVRSWHGQAKEQYLKRYQNLHRQRALRRDEYPKHYPNPAWDLKQVIVDSKKRGDAVLLPAIDETIQGKLFWAALNEIVYLEVRSNGLEAHGEPEAPAAALEALFGRDTLILAANINRDVGASGGEKTPYLLFNVSRANSRFHAYPISFGEYQRQEFHAHVQGWNHGL